MISIEELYRRHADDVLRFAFWLSGDRAEAEELTSETFVRAWSGADPARTETLRAYLFAITRNLYVTGRRRASRHGALDPAHADPSPAPDREAGARLELDLTMAALQEIPEAERTPLLMRASLDLPYEEIARALGISVTVAKVRVHRARKRLAALMERAPAEGGRR